VIKILKNINLFKNIRNFINFISKEKNLVFYSESGFYKKYFFELIEQLNINKISVQYVSSDPNDQINLPFVENYHLSNNFFKILFFLNIKCKYLFLTLTDLNNHSIKRNKYVKKYVYIFHAAISTHKSYTKKAFDNYDIIFCISKNQIDEIRKNEKINNLKKKELIKIGYFYLDLLRKNNTKLISSEKPKILLAPSWNLNKNNFFNIYLNELVDKILEINKYILILRPHPEHFKRSKDLIYEINHKYKNNSNFILDNNIENLKSMSDSDLLITDNSGISIEFLLGLKKPVIYFDRYEKIHNDKHQEISTYTFEDQIKKKFGFNVNNPNFEKIENYIDEANQNFELKKNMIDNFVKDNFFNLDNSAKKGLEFITKN
jgi:YidC/Oxa1 family membrane protein insertase